MVRATPSLPLKSRSKSRAKRYEFWSRTSGSTSMPVGLQQFVADVTACITRSAGSGVQARRRTARRAANALTGAPYQPGIGPHTETAAVALIADLATPLA